MKKTIITAVVLLAVLAGAWGFISLRSGQEVRYLTEDAARGAIRETVTATGTVNAVVTVRVGTQVSGTIKELLADYNVAVRKGQLLALIDPATFEAQVDQARANLSLARANLEKSEASARDARLAAERNRFLFARNFIAESERDTTDTALMTADAQVKASAAQVEQARAALKLAETNLHYTRIVSPVQGTVISRNVDVGQTVAASFQTPTLFTIAQDLTNMQIDTSVDEADIGKVRTGQPVEFSVDAYPDTRFSGRVSEVRNDPITVQNVVTYDAVVRVHNPELKLKPGMTANVSIILAEKTDVLKVPNAALRFRPADAKKTDSGPKGSGGRGKGPAIWVLREGKPQRMPVRPGLSDGTHTEIVAADVKEGDPVITETQGSSARKNDRATPRPPGMFP